MDPGTCGELSGDIQMQGLDVQASSGITVTSSTAIGECLSLPVAAACLPPIGDDQLACSTHWPLPAQPRPPKPPPRPRKSTQVGQGHTVHHLPGKEGPACVSTSSVPQDASVFVEDSTPTESHDKLVQQHASSVSAVQCGATKPDASAMVRMRNQLRLSPLEANVPPFDCENSNKATSMSATLPLASIDNLERSWTGDFCEGSHALQTDGSAKLISPLSDLAMLRLDCSELPDVAHEVDSGWAFKIAKPGQAAYQTAGRGHVPISMQDELYGGVDSSSTKSEGCNIQEDASGEYVGLRTCDYVALAEENVSETRAHECCMPAIPATQAVTARQVFRSGLLFKQGGQQSNKGWRRRHVVFDGKSLKYYANEKSRMTKKIIPVSAMENIESAIKDGDTDRFRFSLKCINRTYWFASEQMDDCLIWTSLLMQAIIQTTREATRVGAAPIVAGGPDMYDPSMYGFLRIDGKAKQFVAIKKGKLCYYKSYEDYVIACPVHQVDMEIASVKEETKLKLQLNTPYHQYILAFDTDEETYSWKAALDESIASALSDESVLQEMYKNVSNKCCADCGAADPDWAVLHLVIIVCKRCAGVHRQLWAPRVKSLKMDRKIWTASLIQLFVIYGNGNANKLWERMLPSEERKINESSDVHTRQSYLHNKYKRKAYFDYHALSGDQPALDAELCSSVQAEGGLTLSMQLIHSGANVRHSVSCGTGIKTVLQLATESGQELQAEALKQTGADGDQIAGTLAADATMQLHTGEINVVMKAGFLEEITKKESMRRWAVLDTSTLRFYTDEHAAIAKNAINVSDVASIAILPSEKDTQMSVIRIMMEGEKSLLLSLPADEIPAWAAALYKVISPVFARDVSEEFDMSGYIFTREGSGTGWHYSWVCLCGKMLLFYDISRGSRDDIDIRKIVKMNLAPQDSVDCPAFESAPPLIINLPNRVVYVQSNFRQDTRLWAASIEKNQKNLSQSLEDQLLTKDNIPVIVDKCVTFVSVYGMEAEGIYRLSATQSVVTSLLESFVQDAHSVHLLPDRFTVHDVANACKRYLRNLTDPVMTSALYSRWLQARAIDDAGDRFQTYKEILKTLPSVNLCTLRRLVGHMQRLSEYSSENKMHVMNLATVFGPVLMTSSSCNNFAQTNLEIQTVADLISNYHLIFEVDQAEISKERAMMEHIKRLQVAQEDSSLQQQSAASAVLSELLLSIYIGNMYGDCVNVKVSAVMTASKLLECVFDVRPRNFATSAHGEGVKICDCSVYEVVCGGDLERPLGDQELVLDTTLHWESWAQEQRRDNYLCVKKNHLSRRLQSVVGADMARFGEIDCYLVNSWKKLYWEFTHANLTCYKDAKLKTQVCSYNIKDMIVYLGIEKKRKAPFKFGFTFLLKSEYTQQQQQQRSSVAGRSMCYSSEDDMYTWLAAILWAQKFPSPDDGNDAERIHRELADSQATAPTIDEKMPAILKHAFTSIKNIMRK